MGAPALAGALLRRARQQAAHLRSLAAQLERERQHHAEAVALAERHRIARELHDVIAHTVSTMVVQAGAAQELLPPDSPAREPVAAVRGTGRDALAELRRLLGVLRSGEGQAPDPQPGVDDLPALVTGSGGTWSTTGEPYDVAPGLGLAVYRIVQEALTNARRHGAGGPATVQLTFLPTRLLLRVSNPLSTAAARESVPSGHGLIGMAERAELYGGAVHAAASRDDWVVSASLPRHGAEQAAPTSSVVSADGATTVATPAFGERH
jgi:signal transduction histidine kinase